MKKFAILILMALGVAALGCGHSNLADPTRTTTNGIWEAHLIGGTGDAALLNFLVGFQVLNINGGTTEPLSIGSFGFINLGACFTTQNIDAQHITGSADLTTNTENQVTGSMNFTIPSQNPPGNTLTLFTNLPDGTAVGGVTGTSNGTEGASGTLSNGVVTGQWTLTGGQGAADCVGAGTFTMCQNTETCSTT